MKRITTMFALLATTVFAAYAQEENEALTISGSVDAYYKYDFSKFKDENGISNINTSFANEQNSVSLGMVNLVLGKKAGKASFVGDVSFGPRGQGQSIGAAKDGNSFHIQNLYMSYVFTEKFSVTAGYMGTFVGYEVISPTGNFNYSTSYLFTCGPFQNAGIKASYSFSDKVGLMVGLFNDWNVYQDFNGVSDFGAQLSLSPAEGWNAYINVLTGYPSGTIIDLTTGYQVSEAVKVGLNVADFSKPDDMGGYTGGALYLQYGFSDALALGARSEYFTTKDYTLDAVDVHSAAVFAATLSAHIKTGPLTVIPEVRFDTNPDKTFDGGNGVLRPFVNSHMGAAKSASQCSLALVYAF